ncbi:MAG: nucleotide pyrophosphatase [Cyanothece sp. SIO1E1]|nr:nucleotide pyrophosphatase [Cyanothece sp. SIO1E1]
MKNPVIAIGLDSAQPALLERWMSQGHLPNLSRLREQGAYGRLKSTIKHHRAELPWTTFLTGVSAEKTGYWGPISYDPKIRGLIDNGIYAGAYDFAEYPPFYALGNDYQVAVLDMPQTKIHEQVNGVQVLAWGAHAPMSPSHSEPSSLLQEMTDQYGPHPLLHRDAIDWRFKHETDVFKEGLKTGLRRRAEICQNLLQKEKWDLLLTIFSETHAAEHFMWHLSQPHPLNNFDAFKGASAGDPMLEVFKAADKAIGEILEKVPDDTNVIVFSAHGMSGNNMDLPSNVFLPELLYRWNFPGKKGIVGKSGKIEKIKPRNADQRVWTAELWYLRHEPNPIKRFFREHVHPKFYYPLRLETLSGKSYPTDLNRKPSAVHWLPASWYEPVWPKMKAFALPSYSEGRIRINLQGRETDGIVPASNYKAVCDEICQILYRVEDGRTGKPLVKKIECTQQSAADQNPKLSDADLIIHWRDTPTDTAMSPDYGRIGPVPFNRAGGHYSSGFLLAKGPGIEPNSDISNGKTLDLTPTILNLMEAPIPDYFEGRALLGKALSIVS